MLLNEILFSFTTVIGSVSFILIICYLIANSKLYKNFKKTNKNAIVLALLFGLLSIYGTISAAEFMGAKINVRDLAPMIAGFVGGPVVGTIAGLIGAMHRALLGGPTVIACSISTLSIGLLCGLFSLILKGKFLKPFRYLLIGAILTIGHCLLVLALTKPPELALSIFNNITFPITILNAIGLTLGMSIFKKSSK